jgi:hypothetical protein
VYFGSYRRFGKASGIHFKISSEVPDSNFKSNTQSQITGWIESRQEQRFLFSKTFKLALELTQSPFYA